MILQTHVWERFHGFGCSGRSRRRGSVSLCTTVPRHLHVTGGFGGVHADRCTRTSLPHMGPCPGLATTLAGAILGVDFLAQGRGAAGRGGEPGTMPLSDGGTAAASGSPATASAGAGPPAPQRAPCRDGHGGVPLGQLAPSRTRKNWGSRRPQH